MEPQLEVGDRVLVSRTAYRLHDANRGDIIVFASPAGPAVDDPFLEPIAEDPSSSGRCEPGDDELIKRVLGLPENGQRTGGHVVVDGRLVDEPYLPTAP